MCRGGGCVLPDFGQNTQAGLQVVRRNRRQNFVAQVARGLFDLLQEAARFALQEEGFAAPMVLRAFAFD